MSSEANPVYKVLRSLWFPMSVNAVAFGTAAVVIFRAVSLLAALVFGLPGHAWEADSLFDDALYALLLGGLPALGDLGRLEGYLPVFAVQCATAYLLWAVFGVAMARTLAVRIARDEYAPLSAAWKFALSTKNTALLHLPCMALPVAFCGGVLAVAGLLGAIPYLGWILNAVLLPVSVFFAVVMQLVWFVGLLALGFTPAAVASERRGTYDAVVKVFHYVFARPLPTLLYLGVLAAFFWVAERAIFAPDRIRDAMAATLGFLPRAFGGGETFELIVRGDVDRTEGFARLCAWLHLLVLGGVDAIVRGAFLSWAAGGFTALFLMFRQECDGTEMSDVVKD